MNTLISKNYYKGVTLIELLIVISAMGILTTILVSSFSLFNKNQALSKDTELIIETLEQARSQTLSSQNGSQYGVHFDTSKITLFTGNAYTVGVSTNQEASLATFNNIVSVSLSGGGNDVVFNRLSGETNQNGTIVVGSPTSSQTKTITIYKTGIIESQ